MFSDLHSLCPAAPTMPIPGLMRGMQSPGNMLGEHGRGSTQVLDYSVGLSDLQTGLLLGLHFYVYTCAWGGSKKANFLPTPNHSPLCCKGSTTVVPSMEVAKGGLYTPSDCRPKKEAFHCAYGHYHHHDDHSTAGAVWLSVYACISVCTFPNAVQALLPFSAPGSLRCALSHISEGGRQYHSTRKRL